MPTPMTARMLALAALLGATATSSHAAEIFGGVYKHAVPTLLSLEGGRERGLDFQLGYRGGPLFAGLDLQPYVFGAVNSAGDTSYAAAGLSWKFGHYLFIRPGIGLAVHDGSTQRYDRPDRIAFGSRILFEPELSLGVPLGTRTTLEATWIHMSQGQVFSKQNPGIDNIGAKLSFGL